MCYNDITLVIPSKPDVERDALANIWQQKGGIVLRLDRFWQPPSLNPKTTTVYGNDTFCLVVAQKIGFELIAPADDLLKCVPQKFVKRCIKYLPLSDALQQQFPIFAKSAAPKIFTAGVYNNNDQLVTQCQGLSLDTMTFISEIVDITCEARCFIYQQQLLDCTIYEGDGDVNAATHFVQQLLDEVPLPSPVVVDVGFIRDLGWAIIEFNAAWGAGLNGCDPQKVIPAIANATHFA